MNDSQIISRYLQNEDSRSSKKSKMKREFEVKSLQGEAGRLGYEDKPIYVKLNGISKQDEGSLVEGGGNVFYINKVSENGEFSELYLFANETTDFVERRNFPKKLIEVC